MKPRPASEPLQTVEADPFARLCVENLQRQLLTHVVSPAPNDQHQSADENARVLVTRTWRGLLRSFDPVPVSFPVPPQTPTVSQGVVV